LRAIHQQVAPHADHILDWFQISMRFKNLEQLAKGINAIACLASSCVSGRTFLLSPVNDEAKAMLARDRQYE
jgi:hypothetical protein